jgi:glutathione S-transferase
MTLQLFAHPFSSYCQKALIALYEHGTPFEYRVVGPGHDDNSAELARRWPLRKFPVLVDGERTLMEASIIVEYVDLHAAGGPRLLPADPHVALEVRLLDRFFDNYVSTPQQKVVADRLRAEPVRDAHGVTEALAMLETAYAWLEDKLADGREWACGDTFTLADCGAAPFLFYADWTHPIDATYANVRGYRQRLLARPSVVRCVEEARPYRPFFPLGAPARD